MKTPAVYRQIFHRVMEISDDLELKDFESPDFYDKYTRALDRCVDDAIMISIKTGIYIGNIFSTLMSLVIIISVDPAFLFFLVIPMFVSLYLGKKNAKCNYNRENEITRDKRIADYVKRVYYEKKYAAEVRLFDINSLMLEKQEKAVDNMERISLGYRLKTALFTFLMKGSYSILAGVFAYLYVILRVKNGNVSDVSSYIAMITAMAFSTDQLKAAVENRIFINNGAKLFQNLEDFLEQDRQETVKKTIITEIDSVEFCKVSFTYPGAEKPTIQNINLKWKKGEKIAIVGYNGAGKTTLIKLIMGFYPVTSGRILINGIDINEIDHDVYRKRYGTVFQDLQVFAMTLAENVLMKRPENEEDYEKVRNALKSAQFDVNHRGLTNGMDTIISREFDEEGFVPSGGQAQKIAIARVFAQSPDMVILDEPSSALDPLAEYNMYNNMMKLSEGKGVIFISHRLSSARMADSIFLMKDGTIVEQGNHDELMKLNGYYHEMFLLQAHNYQESIPEEMLIGTEAYYG